MGYRLPDTRKNMMPAVCHHCWKQTVNICRCSAGGVRGRQPQEKQAAHIGLVFRQCNETNNVRYTWMATILLPMHLHRMWRWFVHGGRPCVPVTTTRWSLCVPPHAMPRSKIVYWADLALALPLALPAPLALGAAFGFGGATKDCNLANSGKVSRVSSSSISWEKLAW